MKAKVKWRRRPDDVFLAPYMGFSFSWPDVGLYGEVSIRQEFDADGSTYYAWSIDTTDDGSESYDPEKPFLCNANIVLRVDDGSSWTLRDAKAQAEEMFVRLRKASEILRGLSC